MRKPFVIANWKMNKNVDEALRFLSHVLARLPDEATADCGIAPQSFAIYPMLQLAQRTPLQIIGQNAATRYAGAYTGEISVRDLAAMGVNYIMLGHSERRALFSETNQTINQKVRAALDVGVTPIICANEEQTCTVVEGELQPAFRQLQNVLDGVPAAVVPRLVLAFEPSGAIGSGHQANLKLAEVGCHAIRREVGRIYGPQIANQVRILYGGSVNPANINPIMALPNVDGVLIGRASLDEQQFTRMINYQATSLAGAI